MAFNIYDESLTRVGEIRTVISSTWEEKFADKGICQLVVANSEAASKLLLPGRFVGKNDKSTLWQIKTKEKREGELWINGFTANYSLLDDRVYDGIHTSNVVADDFARQSSENARRARCAGWRTAELTGLRRFRAHIPHTVRAFQGPVRLGGLRLPVRPRPSREETAF